MKKLNVLIVSCVMVMALLSACGSGRLDILYSDMANMEKSNLEITNDVLGCFSENDAEGLKVLLCAKTQGLTDIDEQILTAFDFFEGEVISFDDYLLGYESESTENGKTTFLERSWNIKDIITNEGAAYNIFINVYSICKDDKNREGISQITITRSDDTELKIGYEWPVYYDEGRDMASKVINAFSENNMDDLKYMLCSKTLEMTYIEAQIQMGLEFFEGEATKGKVEGKNITYDGRHDYHTSVSDDEIVQNGEPISTSITVFNENIETDAGKIYEIEFYAYLLNTDDETYEGISQIIISSDDGRECVIGERVY